MTKRTAITRTLVATAVLAVVGMAHAGSLTVTKRTVANESFGSAFTATTPVKLPDITYTFNTPGGIVVNDGGSVTVVFKISGGQWSSSAALATTNAVAANLPAELVVVAAPVVSTVTTTNDTLTVTVGNPNGVAFGGLANTGTAGANATIGIGGTVTLTSVAAATRYQAIGVTQGTPITVTGKVMNGVSTLEAETAASTVVDYAQAVTLGFTASTETKKIDLTASPAGSALTAGVAGAGKVQLGKIKATNATVAPVDLDTTAGLVETNIVAGAPAFGGAFTVTVAPSSGAFTAKQGVQLYTDAACSVALSGGAPTQAPLATAVTASTTSVVISANGGATALQSAADLVGGVYVCSDYSGVTAGSVLSQLTPTISASYTKASTAYTGDTLGNSTGYALTNNGQTVDVRSYIPAGTTGYTSFVRVINTGTIAAVVNAQWLYEDGTVGTSTALGAAIAAGGAKTYTSTEIEAAIGAPTATIGNNRPRLRLTAPTSGLQAQSFFLNPDNSFSIMHGAD